MSEEKKPMLRKPLEPIDGDVACKAAYDALLVEYGNLKKLKVEEEDPIVFEGETKVPLVDYIARVGVYSHRRNEYVQNFAAHVETKEMVRARVRELARDPVKNFCRIYEEECKFEELQCQADEAFEYAASHTLSDGRVLSDEELKLYEQGKLS